MCQIVYFQMMIFKIHNLKKLIWKLLGQTVAERILKSIKEKNRFEKMPRDIHKNG